MKHAALTDFDRALSGPIPDDIGPLLLDRLSRDLATMAASVGDPRLRVLAAMQIAGNLRDFLIAGISGEAERLMGDAIRALMDHERQLSAAWKCESPNC